MTALTNLASTINREHQLAYEAALDALDHAILCGEALSKAKAAVPEGEWSRWVKDNLDMSNPIVNRYIRLAAYREQLATAEHRPQTINAAITYLRTIDAPPLGTGRNGRRPSFDVDEARRLRELGMKYTEIGKIVGVSDVAVWRQLTPGATARAVAISNRNRSRHRASARTAAERTRDEQMADMGGPEGEAYGLLRQCEAVLDRAIAGTSDHDLIKALTHVHRAEDAVLRAANLEPRKRVRA